MGRVAAEPVMDFDALHFAAKAVRILVCGAVRDNQNEIHVRDGFHPAADCCAAEQNNTDQPPSTIGTGLDDCLDIRLNAKRNCCTGRGRVAHELVAPKYKMESNQQVMRPLTAL